MKTIKDYLFLLKYSAKYSRYVWWSVADGLIWSIYRSFTTVVFLKMIFDKLEDGSPFGEILTIVSIMFAYMMLIYVFHEFFYNYVELIEQQNLHEKMHSELFKQAMRLDIACYDDPKFFNEYVWMLNESDGKAIEVGKDISKFINRIVSSAVVIGVVATIDYTIIMAIVIAVLISVALKFIQTKLDFSREVELKPFERQADYFNRTFYLSSYAQDIRMSNVKSALINGFQDAINEQVRVIKKYNMKMLAIGIIRDLTSSVFINVGVITLLVYKIMFEGSISLGDLAVSISATWTLFWQLNDLLDYFNKLKRHSLYAERLRNFLMYEPSVKNGVKAKLPGMFENIVLRDVYFGYTENKVVLKKINMQINRNDKVALVGYNGAGKSTLIKLLLRLYEPIAGNISWNGNNIRELDITAYRSSFATVFQDFQLFAVSVAENVKTDIVLEEDGKAICEALRKSNLLECIEALDNGIETELTKEYNQNGVILSGGEMQILAIARTFMKQSDIIIMDEPSSALDPMSEYDLNQTMMSAAHDKTVIMISHRLSTTVMMDKIFMLDNGEIIECGSHNELMKLKGKYADMFNKQAEKYRLGV